MTDWTRPPHYVGGVLNVLLPGETSISEAEQERRVLEYVDQRRDERARCRDYSRPLDRLRWVFDRPAVLDLPPST